MHACLISAEIEPGKLDEFPVRFSETILPVIGRMNGFTGVYLMTDVLHNKIVALAIWEIRAGMDIDQFLRQALMSSIDGLIMTPSAMTMEVVLHA